MPRHNPISEARDALIAAVARVNVRQCGLRASADDCEDVRADLERLALAYDGLVDAILSDLAGGLTCADPFEAEGYRCAAHAMHEFIGPALSEAAERCDADRLEIAETILEAKADADREWAAWR